MVMRLERLVIKFYHFINFTFSEIYITHLASPKRGGTLIVGFFYLMSIYNKDNLNSENLPSHFRACSDSSGGWG